MRMTCSIMLAFTMLLMPRASAHAADLPAHEPIGILIVSDRVNPHGLPSHLLTEPGDLSHAIAAEDSGIDVSLLREVDSACIDEALGLLEAGAVDVMIYFAHRSARACDGSDRQAALTTATEALLTDRGGVVVFHHGLYVDDGKDEILALLGGRASHLAWNTEVGQNIIATARDHFVTTHALTYETEVDFFAPALGVGAGRYPAFNNTPDERYPGLQHLETPDETRTLLFASDYDGAQILGYDLHRPDWIGHVVFYQPGEYKPNALDDRDGNNFQILANAIHYVATTHDGPSAEAPEPDDDEPDDDEMPETGDTQPHESTTGGPPSPPAAEDTSGSGCAVGPAELGWTSTPLLVALGRRRETRR
jgi:hypothetical protein